MSEAKSTRFTCIICPTGCSITVDEPATGPLQITGATCKRGKEYAEQEYREPKRMLITTMRIDGGVLPVLPVRSTQALPKQRIFEAVQTVSQMTVRAPIKMGTVVVPNLLNLGVDVIASRDMQERH